MNIDGLARHYGSLNPEERFRLILAASGRGDETERDRLVNTAERITLAMPDHSPYGHAFDELALLVFIELLEESARYDNAFGHAAECRALFGDDDGGEEEGAAAEGGDAGAEAEPGAKAGRTPGKPGRDEQPIAERHFRLGLAAGFVLRTKAEGWKLFCERLSVPPFLLWEGLPGFDRLRRTLALAEKVAFTPEGFLRWMNGVRPAGEPALTEIPLTVEGIADATAAVFRRRVEWWSGSDRGNGTAAVIRSAAAKRPARQRGPPTLPLRRGRPARTKGRNMSLTSAIDALLAFVDSYVAIPLRQQPRFDVSGFLVLDRAVYVEACHLGLSSHMPQPSYGKTRKPFGHTNLPGSPGTNHDPPDYFTPMPSQIPGWRSEMLTLRALAEAAREPQGGGRAGRNAEAAENQGIIVTTADDLWKALAEGKKPGVTCSAISIGPPFGPNILLPTFPQPADQAKSDVLDRALAHCDAEGGDRGEAMRKLIARVALAECMDRRKVINMPLADFVVAADKAKAAGHPRDQDAAGQGEMGKFVEAIQRFINRVLPSGVLDNHTLDEFTDATDRIVAHCDRHGAPFRVEPLSDFKELVLEGLRGVMKHGPPWQLTSEDWKTARNADVLCNRIKGWLGTTKQGREPAAHYQGGAGQAEEGGMTPAQHEEQVQKMDPAVRRAYFAFEYAESKAGKRLKDREAYELLKEEGIPDDKGDLGELVDYELPTLETWTRQLRTARSALGEQKHKSRAGRPTGKSIVRSVQIEQAECDE